MRFCRSLLALFLFSLVSIPSGVDMKPCLLDDCPCIRRGTFDSASLQSQYPSIYEQYKDKYTFSPPVITYPDCIAIIATCTEPAQITFVYSNGTFSIGGKFQKNPYTLTNIYCDEEGWKKSGLGAPLDENIRSANISCALAI